MQAQTLSQGINYCRTFVDGSCHQIHLQTITLHVVLITTERQTGSLMEPFIRNGDQQVPRLSGSMENVRCSPTPCPTPPDSIFLCSWLGQDHSLVCGVFTLSVEDN